VYIVQTMRAAPLPHCDAVYVWWNSLYVVDFGIKKDGERIRVCTRLQAPEAPIRVHAGWKDSIAGSMLDLTGHTRLRFTRRGFSSRFSDWH
jgi:hypothetical protein